MEDILNSRKEETTANEPIPVNAKEDLLPATQEETDDDKYLIVFDKRNVFGFAIEYKDGTTVQYKEPYRGKPIGFKP